MAKGGQVLPRIRKAPPAPFSNRRKSPSVPLA
nr:MAG TPA: hypothetical protein [Caudoviricetes sp.]